MMKSLIILSICLTLASAAPYDSEIITNNIATDNQTINDEQFLHLAAKNGDHMAVIKFIDLGASVNSVSEDGSTSLHKAAEGGKEKVAVILIKNGANVNSKDLDGFTPLHKSISKGHEKMVEILIENNADVNNPSNNGSTPLHAAFQIANPKITEILIKNGADMTILDNSGQSVLKMSLNSINTGMSTLWFGIREMAHKTMHIVSNPMDVLRKSNVEISYNPNNKIHEINNYSKSNHVVKTNFGIDDVLKIISSIQNVLKSVY
ncbi:26S proteasome non-ATPase regulatory subunit 10-like [Contarinia nasturtii]|uniref:26S proteasome non-ATPase regulatory subunit 10-like n=1 Tax=Contarinia nasturtii TaxID=265458 RepID=UPI0012D3EE71|nr:26S proteasome non-ATPase regulatory subunit 10-like [Contarinia nasturtii]